LNDEGFSPFLYGEVAGSSPDDETILFYGHMDKQPPFEGWNEGLHPYKPKLVDGKLYARGGADDGYSVFGSILAIKALQKFGLKHPRIVLLFEADEESGSAHIYHYFETLKQKIGTS
jgi:acetylornithine deacetylase/succinyl-diaminopimelate desuccinylase-like protein